MYDGIFYNGKWYGRDKLISLSSERLKSLVSDTLECDTLTFDVETGEVGDKKLLTGFREWILDKNGRGLVVNDGDFSIYEYGAPVEYWNNGKLLGRFYVSDITRTAKTQFTVSAVSAIGMWDRQFHKGGVYFSVRAEVILNEIFAGTSITPVIDVAIANTPLTGMLPYASKSANLEQVLFATGGHILKENDGTVRISTDLPYTSKEIPSSRIYTGGRIAHNAPATRVSVTEHLWFADPNTETEEIYTATSTADHQLIILSEPYHSITAGSGITINEDGGTYIIISGVGTVSGKKYVHTEQEISWETTESYVEQNEVPVRNATLISPLNSRSVLNRLVKYYTTAKDISCGIVVEDEKPGDLVEFTDEFGVDRVGYIKEMFETMSSITKSDSVIATGYVPVPAGNDFDAYKIVTTSGSLAVPSDYKTGSPVRIVIVGGACGGTAGTNGESGTAPRTSIQAGVAIIDFSSAKGGSGGKAGKGGSGYKMKSVDISSLNGSISVTCGAGGLPVANGATPSVGGDTTATVNGTVYTTSTEDVSNNPFINFITGDVYGRPGKDGIKGGGGGGYDEDYLDGESVTYEGNTYLGGAKGTDAWVSSRISDFAGGGGGGAARGRNGGAGGIGSEEQTFGGSGASAVSADLPDLGCCGNGGSGGGGGGAAGFQYAPYGSSAGTYYIGHNGSGGTGSNGSAGSNGFMILYYKKR